MVIDPDVGSGSGMDEASQAHRLAESLALNNMPVPKTTRTQSAVKREQPAMKEANVTVKEKRAKISRPPKGKKKSRLPKKTKKKTVEKLEKLEKTEEKTSEVKSSDIKSSNFKNTSIANISNETDYTASPTTSATSITSATSATLKATSAETKNDTQQVVEEGVMRSVEEKFHVKPSIGMHVKCKIPGKQEPMKGTLQFLGHINNLPKKSNVIVAGLELEKREELGTDGTFLGKRYFKSAPKRGYFVPVKNCTPI